MIKLKNELHPELLQLGLKSGDVIRDHTTPAKNGAVYFNVNYNGFTQSCVVWPDNYEVLGEQPERNGGIE